MPCKELELIISQEILNKIRRNLNINGLKKIPLYFAVKNFKFFEKYFNLHLTPVHFYSPIPETYRLNPKVFQKIYECVGIDWNLDEQLNYLQEVFPNYYGEYIPTLNTGLSMVDSFILYSMIRKKRPKIIIEVGGGDTTSIIITALKRNRKEGYDYTFCSIDPYPPKGLREIKEDGYELLERKVQEVDLSPLNTADLLFIDSSHVCKIDSDVNFEILEVIPKLKVGAVVHWHDIMIPTNYWKEWIDHGNKFWNESYMVHSFMLFNSSFKVIWASRYMQLNHPKELRKQFSYFHPEDMEQQNLSFWIERIR